MIEINNKYNVGDTLWTMYENKPTIYNIERITIVLTIDESTICYVLRKQGAIGTIQYTEAQLDEIFYPTKEKCILSLFDK